jgi:carbonic anhydrase
MLTALLLLSTVASYAAEWDYVDPSSWAQDFPLCGGSRQSPIDIITSDLVEDKDLPELKTKYCKHKKGTLEIVNNGHTLQVNFPDLGEKCDILSRGNKDYKLAQFHLHWGGEDSEGSEHTVDGKSYPAELHAVHYDVQFSDLGSAVASGKGDALLVLGVFLTRNGADQGRFQNLLAGLLDAPEQDSSPIDLGPMFLPKRSPCYAHYEGSLTTPTCNEIVQWYLEDTPYGISEEHLSYLRGSLIDGGLTEHNFRPTQPLNGRVVTKTSACMKQKGKSNNNSVVFGVTGGVLFLGLVGVVTYNKRRSRLVDSEKEDELPELEGEIKAQDFETQDLASGSV